LLAVACLYTYLLKIPETHTYAATGITDLNATTQSGAISVTASQDSVITVGVEKYAYGRDSADAGKAIVNVVYRDTIVGNELGVKAEMPSGSRPYGANFNITAPESTALSLSTANGDVSVTNMVGNVKVSTSNGNVELIGTTGTAGVSTTNGTLTVKVHSGGIEGTTTNGAVDCDLAALGATDSVGLATTNGKVTLLLPEEVSALIDATDTNGLITIYDYTVTYEILTDHHVRARIGSAASSIAITATNGDVTVRRRS